MSARSGARLSPKDHGGLGSRKATDWFRLTIYLRMRGGDRSRGPYLQADETPVRCQDPDEGSGETLTRSWVSLGDQPARG